MSRRRWALAAALAVVAVVAGAFAAGGELPRRGEPSEVAGRTRVTAPLSRHAGDEPAAHFTVDGTRILGPSAGKEFVPVGMNLLGPDAFFNEDGRTAGHARRVADVWGANTVRLNACLPRGCDYTGVHNQHNDDLDGLIEEYTGEGLVVIVAMHQIKPGHWPTPGELDEIEAWWRDVARRHGDDQRVWFNLLNEPGAQQPAPRQWLELHERLVRAVRDEGAGNLLVVDGTQWGQEAGTREARPVADEDSAILTWGDELKAIDDRIVFSFHVYDQWGPPEVDDAARDARLADFIDRVHAAGHAVLIGETGGCCDREALGTRSAYRVAPAKGVGILAWHGQGVHDYGLTAGEVTAPDGLDDLRAPTNLTWHGQLLWELTHR